jgi:dinuclear metal center YbgI/SA1388 family protein
VVSLRTFLLAAETILQSSRFQDSGLNGLQVEGKPDIERLAVAVDADLDTIERALAWKADILVVHHGIFWGNGPQAITSMIGRRVARLLAGQCSLAAWHLPLDAHPEFGMNACIARLLSLHDVSPFAQHKGAMLGCQGRLPKTLSISELTAELHRHFGTVQRHASGGPNQISRVGVLAGGGQFSLAEAAQAGLDALITGDASQNSWYEAKELGIHLFACGHTATETLGIRALGEQLTSQLKLTSSFFQPENPW